MKALVGILIFLTLVIVAFIVDDWFDDDNDVGI